MENKMDEKKHGKFNSSNLDGKFKRKKRFYVEDGSNLYRVLPPFGSLAEQGVIAKFWGVYWLEDSKGGKKPVSTIEKRGAEKKIIQEDPIATKVAALQKGFEAAKLTNTDPVILQALEDRIYRLQLDKAYYLNVINPANEIGVLKIKYTAFQALKEKIRKLEQDQIDPINIGTGVFFDFQKNKDDKGKVVYTVDVHQKTFKNPTTGKFTTEIVEATIDESILVRMEKEAEDLNTLYRIFSPEEQAALATLDGNVISRMFSRGEEIKEEEGDDLEEDLTVSTSTKVSPTATVNTTATAQTIQAAATQEVTQTVVAGPKPTVAATPTEVQDMVSRFLNTGKI
jgi:hypothetical protein